MKVSSEKYAFIISSFLYACIGLLLGSNYSPYLFFVYVFVTAIMDIVLDIGYPTILQNLIDRNAFEEYITEYQVVYQYMYAIGEVFTLSLLYFIHIPILHAGSLSIILIIVTLVPLFIVSLLSKTNVFKKEEEFA